MGFTERERRGFQLDQITTVLGPTGSYILFPKGSVVSDISPDHGSEVTFDRLLNEEMTKHNDNHAFGVNQVRVEEIEGSATPRGKREIWSQHRLISWDPERQSIMHVVGSREAVQSVIAGAKRAARQAQIDARPPLRAAA